MENYKKKPLRFSGFSKEVRIAEVNTLRQSSRDTRYSFMRPIADVENSPKENLEQDSLKPKYSKIPKPGSKPQLSRLEMLKKFQEEKQLKKLKEQVTKKPVFKCGIIPPKPLPPFNSNLSRVQNVQPFKLRSSSRETPGVKSKNSTLNPFNPKLPGTTNAITKSLTTKVTQAVTGIKPVAIKSKIASIPTRSNQKISLQTITEKKADPKPNQKPPTTVKDLKPSQNKINKPVTIAKPPLPRLPSKEKPSIPTRSQLRPPATEKPDLKQIQNKIAKPSTVTKPPPSRLPNKGKSTTDRSKVTISKRPQIKINSQEHSAIKTKMTNKKPPKKVSEDSEVSSKEVTFSCQLSMIEPVGTEKKSFAPEGFLFCPRSEWYSSYLLDDAPLSIYARLKAEQGRTSTPISKTDSNSERKSSECHEGSFIQNTEIEPEDEKSDVVSTESVINANSKEPEDENSAVVSTENVIDTNSKESDLPQPRLSEIPVIVEDTLVQEKSNSCPKYLVQDIAASEPLEVPILHSLEEKSLVISPVQPLQLPSLRRESSKTLDKEVVISEQIPQTLPEFFVEPKQLKQTSPDVTISCPKNNRTDPKQAASILSPKQLKQTSLDDVTISHPESNETDSKQAESILSPKQPQNSTSKICTLTTNQVLKDSFKVSLLTSFTPISTASESKGTFGGVKTRSFYGRNKTSFLDRIDDSIGESPAVQVSASKPRRKKVVPEDFTPRRSARLAKKSTFGSMDNIFDEQPSFVDTPPDDEAHTSLASGLTLDFEKLRLDATPCASQESLNIMSTRASNLDTKRISLLYTPPRRRSSLRKSVLKQDLMSFSP